jgi:hypothetical protein
MARNASRLRRRLPPQPGFSGGSAHAMSTICPCGLMHWFEGGDQFSRSSQWRQWRRLAGRGVDGRSTEPTSPTAAPSGRPADHRAADQRCGRSRFVSRSRLPTGRQRAPGWLDLLARGSPEPGRRRPDGDQVLGRDAPELQRSGGQPGVPVTGGDRRVAAGTATVGPMGQPSNARPIANVTNCRLHRRD